MPSLLRPTSTPNLGSSLAPQITAMFHSKNWQVLEERGVTGLDTDTPAVAATALAQNIWSTVYVDALAARDRDADGSTSTQGKGVAYDGLAVSSALEERTFTQTDANFNVTSLVSDATDTVVERYAYLPYGQSEVLTVIWSARPATAHGNPHRFQGLRLDAATGLHHARFRDYADWLGRWTQQDPAGWPDGVGRKEFVSSSPLMRLDPSGLKWYHGWGQALSALAGQADPEVQREFDKSNRDRYNGTAVATGLPTVVGDVTTYEENRDSANGTATIVVQVADTATDLANPAKGILKGVIKKAST